MLTSLGKSVASRAEREKKTKSQKANDQLLGNHVTKVPREQQRYLERLLVSWIELNNEQIDWMMLSISIKTGRSNIEATL